MKNLKRLTIGLFVFLLAVVFIKEDMIKTYAISHEITEFSEDIIYKSGDTIKILKPYEIVHDEESEDEEDTWNYYTYIINYNTLSDYYYDGSYDEITPTAENNYKITMPSLQKYNDETGEYDSEDGYWIVSSVSYDDYYSEYTVTFEQIEYTPPTAKIECNATEISSNESAECILSVEYIEQLKELDFEIKSDLFAISEGTGLNNWQVNNEQSSDNKYSLTYGKSNNVEGVSYNNGQHLNASFLANTRSNSSVTLLANGTIKDVFKFTVNTLPDVETVSLSGNIKVEEIKYTDEKGKGLMEAQLAKINIIEDAGGSSNSKEDGSKASEKNPVTSDNVIIFTGVFIISSLVVAYIIKFKKKNGIKRFNDVK